MTIEVLVATMHQTDYSLLDKMNIQTDAIIVNQCDKNEIVEFEYNGHKIKWLSLAERGVGLSRNTALMRATADIVLFADDDVVYEDNYAEKIIREYESHPKRDVVLFNLLSLNPERPVYIDKKAHRIRWFNSLRYGACRISANRMSLLKNNIVYSLLFGGGAPHQAGEDNLFLVNSLQNGLRVYASTEMLGTVAQEESTWFRGYDDKYYFDRGYLFGAMFKRLALPVLFLFEIKKRQKGVLKRMSIGRKGIAEFKKKNYEKDISNFK